jgi:hypothetical protein
MSNQNLVCVFVGTSLNANYLKSVLQESGIECLVRDFLQESSLAGFAAAGSDDAASVYVDEKDLEKAEEIVLTLFEK